MHRTLYGNATESPRGSKKRKRFDQSSYKKSKAGKLATNQKPAILASSGLLVSLLDRVSVLQWGGKGGRENFMLKRYIIPLLIATLFISAGSAYAKTGFYFPQDAKSVFFEGSNLTSNRTLLGVASGSPVTILQTSISNSGNVQIEIYCGSQEIAHSYGAGSYTKPISYLCLNTVRFFSSSNVGDLFVNITYTRYDLASESFGTTASTTTASTSFYEPLTASTSIVVSSEMTTGDLLLVLGFFTVIMLMLLNIFFLKV